MKRWRGDYRSRCPRCGYIGPPHLCGCESAAWERVRAAVGRLEELGGAALESTLPEIREEFAQALRERDALVRDVNDHLRG